MKKRILLSSLGLCLTLTLTGCVGVNGALERKMLEQAGITAEENYQSYESYRQEGKLTAQGYYSEVAFEAEEDESGAAEGAAHVSFARNGYLEVRYFTDAAHTQEITDQAAYFEVGQKIYAAVSVHSAPASTYTFSAFRLYRFTEEGREQVATLPVGENGPVLEIGSDMQGGDFALEPIGSYGSRKLTLRDYYSDDAGSEHELDGTWRVDEKATTAAEAEIGPTASAIISYEYDNEEYFYLSSSPKCYYNSHEDGIVIFEQLSPTQAGGDYSVELHQYLSAEIETAVERTVTLNDEAAQTVKAGSKFTFEKLKYSDELRLVTDEPWPQLERSKKLIVTASSAANGRYTYRLTVPQKGGEFVFDPQEYSYEHGSVVFQCFGEVVTGPQYLAKGTTIFYSAGETDEGYRLPEGNSGIVVGEEAETRAALQSIAFIPEIRVTVRLPQPQYGGRIRYFAEGKEITDEVYETVSGTDITMEFEPWQGWINHYMNGETYHVTDRTGQTILIGGESVQQAFSEDAGHRPTLEVVLEESVGEAMEFTVTASGLPTTECRYEGGLLGRSKTVIKPTPIGTESGILLTMGNRSLQAGTALKIQVELRDTQGNKTEQCRLVNRLTEQQAPICLYEEEELGVSEIWYKSVKITIGVVEAGSFTAPEAPMHGVVTVRRADTQEVLTEGCLVEPTEQVIVTITPRAEYYVKGKHVKNDIYQQKMKFSAYQKNAEKILAEHPIRRYVHLILAAEDPYGTCAYMVGKAACVGSVGLKEGEELTICYTVTAEGWRIAGGSGGLFGFGRTEREVTKTLTVTAALDGAAIGAADFGIQVEKGE